MIRESELPTQAEKYLPKNKSPGCDSGDTVTRIIRSLDWVGQAPLLRDDYGQDRAAGRRTASRSMPHQPVVAVSLARGPPVIDRCTSGFSKRGVMRIDDGRPLVRNAGILRKDLFERAPTASKLSSKSSPGHPGGSPCIRPAEACHVLEG